MLVPVSETESSLGSTDWPSFHHNPTLARKIVQGGVHRIQCQIQHNLLQPSWVNADRQLALPRAHFHFDSYFSGVWFQNFMNDAYDIVQVCFLHLRLVASQQVLHMTNDLCRSRLSRRMSKRMSFSLPMEAGRSTSSSAVSMLLKIAANG
jgi:hypothetical protein